jgi:FAD/FMN-containing dehydrogenase
LIACGECKHQKNGRGKECDVTRQGVGGGAETRSQRRSRDKVWVDSKGAETRSAARDKRGSRDKVCVGSRAAETNVWEDDDKPWPSAIRAAREIKANEVVHSLLQLRCGCVGHAEWEQCLPRTSSHLSWPRWSRASHLLGCCVAQEFDSKRGRKTGESQERGSRLWRELHGTWWWWWWSPRLF